jgi:hypothetical protein
MQTKHRANEMDIENLLKGTVKIPNFCQCDSASNPQEKTNDNSRVPPNLLFTKSLPDLKFTPKQYIPVAQPINIQSILEIDENASIHELPV